MLMIEFCERAFSVENFSKIVLFCEKEMDLRKTNANSFLQISDLDLVTMIRSTDKLYLD